MNIKSNLVARFLIFLTIFCACKNSQAQIKTEDCIKYATFPDSLKCENKQGSKILLLFSCYQKADHYCWGGTEENTLILYQELLKHEINASILIPQESLAHKKFTDLHLNHYVATNINFDDKYIDAPNSIDSILYKLCKDNKIDIIHAQWSYEVAPAQRVAQRLNIAFVTQYHFSANTNVINFYKSYAPNAFVSVSPESIRLMKESNSTIKFVEFIPPLFNTTNFLNFKTNKTKEQFFKEQFNINIKKMPIICLIGNFYECKNHETLMLALHYLIYEFKIPAQVVLAGMDYFGRMALIKKFTQILNIQDYVHFLDFTKEIPAILYHSDVNIVPNYWEAFGITIIEASMMKKPTILSKTADLANIAIIPEKTGLLFDPNNAHELAIKIKKIIEDPEFGKAMGENAYKLVTENFTGEKTIAKIIDLYKCIYIKNTQ